MGHFTDQRRALSPAPLRVALLLPALLCMAGTAHAASGSAEGKADIRSSITIEKNSDLNFGDFIAGTTVSRFRISAVNGNLIKLSGDAISIGGTQTRASFTATGTPNTAANIRRSQSTIDIVRTGGTETMRVDNFWLGNSAGLRDQILDASGKATYYVGGRLQIGANQVPGAYSGTFSVTIEYQ